MVRRYKDESLVVEKREAPIKEEVFSMTDEVNKTITLSVRDALDILAGYEMDTHPVIKVSPSNDTGTCLMCGKGTNAPERKLCWECHGKYVKDVYKNAVDALESGNQFFQI